MTMMTTTKMKTMMTRRTTTKVLSVSAIAVVIVGSQTRCQG
jgi:hypothetical protein